MSSCDLSNNTMAEYVKQIDEFIYYETEILDLYKKNKSFFITRLLEKWNMKSFTRKIKN